MAGEGKIAEGMVVESKVKFNYPPPLNAFNAKEASEQLEILLDFFQDGDDSEGKERRFVFALRMFKNFTELDEEEIAYLCFTSPDVIEDALNGSCPPYGSRILITGYLIIVLKDYAIDNAS